jgi:RNA polymerase sigma factor (sigma-70 family)
MAAADQILLDRFAREGSQEAFTALVKTHVNLVYTAALRQVRAPDLAEEVSQSVFISLARHAGRLAPDTILTAWLYQVTRNAAIDIIRREAARQAREQIAFQMSAQNDSPSTSWMDIEPHLDEAMDSLEAADRTALLLRYFENKSLREVGEALGASEDAAQKRVTRALDRLRDYFGKRKLSIGASALAALLSANAIQAAPVALALTIASASAGGAATISAAALSNSIALTMTATQKAFIAAFVVVAAVTVGVQSLQTSNLRAEAQRQRQESLALSNDVKQLQTERDQARQQVAALIKENAAKAPAPGDSLKLRGEVSQLRKEKNDLGATSGLSKITANPETKRIMREQQKAGMTMLYGTFAKDAKLTTEQTEKLNDALADHIMENVDNVTTALRQKLSPEEASQVFNSSEANLSAKLRELMGDEAFDKYQQYNKDILGNITAQQFKTMMSGDEDAKKSKADQMSKILNEEGRAVLAAANLPKDYQLMPMLNFRNIASETEAEKSLQLIDDLYTRSLERLSTVLSKEEIAKFQDLKAKAIANNRAALAMNRNLMAPIAD